MGAKTFLLYDEQLLLLPQGALLLPRLNTLILSDLHLGKINHFRKAGIPVPTAANLANTERLVRLLMEHKPNRIIFIGDLFHSHYNTEWEVLGQVIKNFTQCSFELVPGNHDIMSQQQYKRHSIKLHEKIYAVTENIKLVHEPQPETVEPSYYLSGHIHPAITLTGKARQSLTFPCFWFGARQGYLPAFGVFTGFKAVRPEKRDRIFGIVKEDVIEVTEANESSTE